MTQPAFSSVVDALERLPRRPGRGMHFVSADRSERFYVWEELWQESRRRAAHLARLGLSPGDRVALVLPEPEDFVLTFFGALTAGLVPVPIYPRATFKGIEGYLDVVSHILDAARARALVTSLAMRPFMERVPGRPTSLETLAFVEEAFHGHAPPHAPPAVNPSEVCFLQFTSGSTSRPKGVMVTHQNLVANAAAFLGEAGLARRDDDVAVSWLPLYHDMGLIGCVLGTVLHDLPVVLMPTASFARMPRLWLEALHKYRGTLTYAPNFAYQLVARRVKDADLAALELSHVRVFGCGAEPIRAQTWREFAARLAPAGVRADAFLPSYGMAEATLAISFHTRDTPMRADRVDPAAMKLGYAAPAEADAPGALEIVSCGRPFPGHELAIVNERGEPLAERQVGEIVIRGPSVTRGYYENPEATRAIWRDGWLHTGDLGYLVDGNVHVCGRLKDMIILKGANYYPQDLEWVIGDLEKVRRGNVVAFSVLRDGVEELVLVAEGNSTDAAELRASITETVARAFGLRPLHVAIVPTGSLPKTSSGKPQRRSTKQMFEEGALPEHA